MKKFIFIIFLLILMGTLPAYAQEFVDMNAASFVQDGDWVYYGNPYDSNLYKIRTDGTENTRLIDDGSGNYIFPSNILGNAGICFDDKYIYFTSAKRIFKIDKITKECTQVCEMSEYGYITYIYDDRLSYLTYKGIFSVKTDGTDIICLSSAGSLCVAGEKGYIYYPDFDNGGIYKSSIFEKGETKISDDKALYIIIENGCLYYDNRTDEGKLYKMNTDGTGRGKLNDVSNGFMMIKDGWIYFTSYDELCKYNVNTQEIQYLARPAVNNINVIGDTVFFSGYNGSTADMYMMNVNGGEVREFLLDKSLFGNGVDLQVLVKGKKLSIEDGDIPPLIIDDRILIPIRAFANALNMEVEWSEETQTAQLIYTQNINSVEVYTTVIIKPDSDVLTLEESTEKQFYSTEEIKLDVPATAINGRIMVPIRAIAEAFNYNVSWYGDSKTAHIYGSIGPQWFVLKDIKPVE